MKDINIVTVCGRLVRDAELSYTQSGFAICKLSLAVNRNIKKGDQWEDEANFFDMTIIGKRGEALTQYLTKGQQVVVSGELRQERWEKEGQKRSKVTIHVNDLQLVGSKPSGSQARGLKAGNAAGFEDDIPF